MPKLVPESKIDIKPPTLAGRGASRGEDLKLTKGSPALVPEKIVTPDPVNAPLKPKTETLVPEHQLTATASKQAQIAPENRISSPSNTMSTPRPQPGQVKRKTLTKDEQNAVNLANIRTKQMINTMSHRQNWRNDPKNSRRVERALANDKTLVNALFLVAKGSAIPFVQLSPKEQLRVVRQVRQQIQQMTHAIAQQNQRFQIDPRDVTHPANQANPFNLTNQWMAIMQSIILNENNDNVREIQQENLKKEFVLTEVEENEIAEKNSLFTKPTAPEPKPTQGADEAEKNEMVKESTLALEEKNANIEQQALKNEMEDNKPGFIENCKGNLEEKVGGHLLAESAIHAATSALVL